MRRRSLGQFIASGRPHEIRTVPVAVLDVTHHITVSGIGFEIIEISYRLCSLSESRVRGHVFDE
jgi:hypothetical protein